MPSQISQITVSGYGTLELFLDMTAVVGDASDDFVFRAGDYIQLNGFKVPYTVTADVLRGTASTISIPLNRPFKTQTGLVPQGTGIRVGSDVTWEVVMTKKPAVEIVPYDLISFSSAFELAEVIEE